MSWKTFAASALLTGGLLMASNASAVVINDGSETSLQEILNAITVKNADGCENAAGGCQSSVDVDTDQREPLKTAFMERSSG